MANRKDHLFFGGIAGVGACLVAAAINGQKLTLTELIGSALSAVIAARVPDWLEPATHPNHRAFFHSLTFASVGLPPLWTGLLQEREEQLRAAAACELNSTTALNRREADMWREQARWRRLYAGILLGFIPGYVSHLAADALTPKSLPLL